MLIFLDTEFTNLVKPTLISIGLVAENGQELYLENMEFRLEDCSEFVRKVVLPQLGKAPDSRVNRQELKKRLLGWFNQFNDCGGVIVASDYNGDWTLLCDALDDEIPAWIGHGNIWDHLNDLLVEQFFMETGLSDHHALHDAKANKYAYRQR